MWLNDVYVCVCWLACTLMRYYCSIIQIVSFLIYNTAACDSVFRFALLLVPPPPV